MISPLNAVFTLAQAATTAAPTGTGTTGGQTAPGWMQLLSSPLFPVALVLLALMFFSGSAKRKQEKERKNLLDNLKKGDMVRLIGGEFGTVADVRGDRVLIKVDENSNTKILYAREAISSVVKEEAAK